MTNEFKCVGVIDDNIVVPINEEEGVKKSGILWILVFVFI